MHVRIPVVFRASLYIFQDKQRLSTSGLLGTHISADYPYKEIGEGEYIPIFAFNSNELKPKDLPSKLEKYWPLPI